MSSEDASLVPIAGEAQLRFTDRLLYPTAKTVNKISALSLPPLIAGDIALFAGADPSIAAPTLVAGIPIMFAGYRRKVNRIQVNDHLSCVRVKQTEDVDLADNTRIRQGDSVGELHFRMDFRKRRYWQNLTPVSRGRSVASIGLDGLATVAEKCSDADEQFDGFVAFYGLSRLIRPQFFTRLGFETQEVRNTPLIRFGTALSQMAIYGPVVGMKLPVKNIHEMWITRGQLVESLPKLQQLRDRLLPNLPAA